jgi:hypothetical protein
MMVYRIHKWYSTAMSTRKFTQRCDWLWIEINKSLYFGLYTSHNLDSSMQKGDWKSARDKVNICQIIKCIYYQYKMWEKVKIKSWVSFKYYMTTSTCRIIESIGTIY